MAQARKKPLQYKSPVGVAVWPRLNKPDTKFNADGIYSVRLRFHKDNIDTKVFLSMLESLYQDAVREMTAQNGKPGKKLKLADRPWKDAEDDAGNPTGEVEVNFKMKAIVRSQKVDPATGKLKEPWVQKPGVFDRYGKAIPETVRVSGGSTMRVAFNAIPFYTAQIGAGITIRLLGVQVVDLVEFSGKSFSGLGFDTIDGDDVEEVTVTASEDDAESEEGVESSVEGDEPF
jgi:hypothetical protein